MVRVVPRSGVVESEARAEGVSRGREPRACAVMRVQVTKAPERIGTRGTAEYKSSADGLSCTCGGSRWELLTAAAGVVRTDRRGRQGLHGHGGLGRLAV